MKIDLHCHTKYSLDNDMEPEELIEQALRMGLDGICITEHFSVQASLPVEAVPVPDGFFVFRGVEISTDTGHLLAYGIRDDSWNIWNENLNLNVRDVIEQIHRLGGICAASHPFRGLDSFGAMALELNGLDAIETHNGRNTIEMNSQAMSCARIRNLPSIGGSDCHRKEHIGRVFTVFSNPVKTIADLVAEIQKGNCCGSDIRESSNLI
jgi:predicted metal-dependent phosphoesterase TrpH